MTRREYLPVPLLMILGFVATLAATWPGRAPQRVALIASVSAPRWSAHAQPPVTAAAPTLPPALMRAPAPVAAPAAASEDLPGSGSGGPLPVSYEIHSRGRGGRISVNPDGTPASSTILVVDLHNDSDQPLDVAVAATNLTTQETTQAQLSLLPHRGGRAGPERGLNVESGDQLILSSPGYQELTGTVP